MTRLSTLQPLREVPFVKMGPLLPPSVPSPSSSTVEIPVVSSEPFKLTVAITVLREGTLPFSCGTRSVPEEGRSLHHFASPIAVNPQTTVMFLFLPRKSLFSLHLLFFMLEKGFSCILTFLTRTSHPGTWSPCVWGVFRGSQSWWLRAWMPGDI